MNFDIKYVLRVLKKKLNLVRVLVGWFFWHRVITVGSRGMKKGLQQEE